MTDVPPALRMRGITKSFAGTLALDGVDFEVEAGTVHGLVGENGAGKSTLLKILAGDVRAGAGTVEIDGERVVIEDPHSAREHGIGVVYQELSLLPNLTVAQNISLGVEPSRRLHLDAAAMDETARAALDQLGVSSIDPRRLVSHLSLPERQLVEIARVLTLRRPRVLVFDEPTAALAFADVERLFATMARLREGGAGIVFVSHRYREVLDICDACTVLRNGRRVGGLTRAEASIERLVELTLGRSAESVSRRAASAAATPGDPPQPPLLEVDGLSIGALVREVSFSVRGGEIVSLCGLLGMGQTAIARAVIGDGERVSGSVRIGEHAGRPRSAHEAVRLGIGLIPENRQDEGLFPDMAVRANVSISSLQSVLVSPAVRLVSRRRERGATRAAGAKAGIDPAVLGRPVRTLSGGNQQKSLLARWLLRGCRLLVCIEPTRGVDVGAKAEIYRQLDQLARGGAAILVVSTDLPEVLTISDRVLVVYRGRITAELPAAELDEATLLIAMQGGGTGARSEAAAV
jgi:ABC-type sugar transport system ATPase subunit